MPGNRDDERRDETPRTGLPPEREPYDEGHFGTEEEEGVTQEREESGGDAAGAARDAAEEGAGGDREIR